MTPSRAARLATLAGLLIIWTVAQVVWLRADARIVDGDEMSNVGAVELFYGQAHAGSVMSVITAAYTEDFGEYPALYPALLGALSARAGVQDLNGDGPALLGLLWAWLAAAATAAMAAALALRGDARVGSTTVGATLLLLCSPLWSALQRHVMLETGVTALVAVVGAAVCWARVMEDQGSRRRSAALWALAGVAASAALLVKQTAILALVPIGVALWLLPGRRRWVGPLGAAVMTLVTAGPWYVSRLGGDYLLRSAEANPDAVGLAHQLAYYPAVLVQEAWAPLLLVAGVGWAIRERALGVPSTVRFTVATVVLGILALVVIPKKYARLLLPLLPFAATGMALVASRWSGAGRAVVAAFAVGTFAASMVGLPSTTSVGLRDVDERCTQQWIQAPDGQQMPWAGVLAAIDAAGGREGEIRVGAIRWPVPPCAHQTTHDLGEHLRVRARRAGFEAWIAAGEGYDDEWTAETPDLLIHAGPVDAKIWRRACARTGEPTAVVVPGAGSWISDVMIYPCAP